MPKHSSKKIILALSLILLSSMACSLFGGTRSSDETSSADDVENDSSLLAPVPVGGQESPGPLLPGGSVIGIDDLLIGAGQSSISEEIFVWIEASDDPVDDTLPSGMQPQSDYYRIGATDLTHAAPGSPFTISMPVQQAEDADLLMLGVLQPAESLLLESSCEAEDCSQVGSSDVWIFMPGVYDPDQGVFTASLGGLSDLGQVIVLLSSPDFQSLLQDNQRHAAAVSLGPVQQQAQFTARCIGFSGSGITCGSTEISTAGTAFGDAYSDFVGLGFKTPNLATDPSDDAFLVDIRPYTNTSAANADGDLDLCEIEAGTGQNNGMYDPLGPTMTICIAGGGVTAGVIDTARHEYFHATQFAYSQILDNDFERWIVEGTAAASENSLAMMGRDLSRDLHDIEIELDASGDFVEYEAQDFWVYLGRRFNQGLDYLIDLFDQGALLTDVEDALQQGWSWAGSNTLSTLYWDWVKNQSFEVLIPHGDGSLGSTCGLATATASPIRMDYSQIAPPAPQQFTLPPLSSKVFEIAFDALDVSVYNTEVSVISNSPDIRVKYYDLLDSGTTVCQGDPDGRSRPVSVPAVQGLVVFVLVSNTSTSQQASATLEFDSGEPRLQIVSPFNGSVFNEGDSVEFSAVATGFTGGNSDLIPISWRTIRYDGVPNTFGSSGNGEIFPYANLCDGRWVITAEAIDASTSATVQDQIEIVINDLGATNPPAQCGLSVQILSPAPNSKFRVGDSISLQAAINDDHYETNQPLYPVIWHANDRNGRILGNGLNSSTKLDENTNTIFVEYGSAGASINIQVQETPNTPPAAAILSPNDGAQFHYYDPGAGINGFTVNFSGQGTDSEDGNLAGSKLVWSYRQVSTSQWLNMGSGNNVSFEFRYTSGWAHYEVRLSVTDSEGLSGPASTDTITIQVQGPPS